MRTASVGRTHDRTRPRRRHVNITLASKEPSTQIPHGPHHRRFWLTLADNGGTLMLAFSARVLAIDGLSTPEHPPPVPSLGDCCVEDGDGRLRVGGVNVRPSLAFSCRVNAV